MRELLTSVPLLTIALSIFSAITVSVLIPQEVYGSCFEGECGFFALIVVVPITILVALPVSWVLIKQLGDLSRIFLWLPIVMLLGALLWGTWFGLVIAPLLLVAVAVMTIRQHMALKSPLRTLFLRTRTTAPNESK